MIRMHNMDLLFIAKPKISGSKAEEVLKRINMQCLERVETEGRSGGLGMFIRNNTYNFEVIKVGFNFIHLSTKGGEISKKICIAVYIYPQSTWKK